MKPTIKRNFLPEPIFQQLRDYVKQNHFSFVTVGEKTFSVCKTPDFLLDFLQIENHELILSFLRESYTGFDNSINIHADHLINGQKVALASVLYINNKYEASENGTAFYKHYLYGDKLPENISDQEHDRLLVEDANDPTKFEMYDCVIARPNSLLTYDGSLFHSKYPADLESGVRVVLVAFYKKKDDDLH